MATTYTSLLRLAKPTTGELSGTWGDVVNDNITSMIEQAISGKATVAMADANQTLTVANGVTDQARCAIVECTGAMSTNRNVVCPTSTKVYIVNNLTTGGFSIVFKTVAGTGITISAGSVRSVYCDGTNVVAGGDTFATLGANTFTGNQSLAENAAVVLTTTLSADGKYSGVVEAGTSAAALAFGALCYRVTATGKWALAKADVAATSANQLGMCVLAAGGADVATTMLLYGKVRADALFDTFTVGAPLYASAGTAGKTVSAAPTGTTDFVVRKVGSSEDGNTVFFNPSNDYVTLA